MVLVMREWVGWWVIEIEEGCRSGCVGFGKFPFKVYRNQPVRKIMENQTVSITEGAEVGRN